jgi:hypothetical protein
LQYFLTRFQPDNVNAAVAGDNVIAEVSVVDSMARKWVEDRGCAVDVVKFSKFVGAIGVYNQKVIASLAELDRNVRPRLWP